MNKLADSSGIPNGVLHPYSVLTVHVFTLFSSVHAAIVGYCDLSSPDVEDVLRRQSEHKRMRGIRQMLNYHSEHPQYCAVSHDNYLTDPNWIKGFSLLEKYNLSFDLHILPHQMKRYNIATY